jgi:hypothetical protein
MSADGAADAENKRLLRADADAFVPRAPGGWNGGAMQPVPPPQPHCGHTPPQPHLQMMMPPQMYHPHHMVPAVQHHHMPTNVPHAMMPAPAPHGMVPVAVHQYSVPHPMMPMHMVPVPRQMSPPPMQHPQQQYHAWPPAHARVSATGCAAPPRDRLPGLAA